jgi:hypothetical protein
MKGANHREDCDNRLGMHYCGLDISQSQRMHTSRMIKAALEAYDHVDHADGIERALGRYSASGLSVAVETGGQTAWIHEVLIRSSRDV